MSQNLIESPIRSNYADEINELIKLSHQSSFKLWEKLARETLSWQIPFTTAFSGSFKNGDAQWFSGGCLNVCYNCVDRHCLANSEKTALIWEKDEPGNEIRISYKSLLENICKIANILRFHKFSKGDVATIYMPTIPQTIYSMLACARLGIVHNVVFAGFRAESLAQRISNSNSKILFTIDEGRRGGKTLFLKKIVDEAINFLGSSSPIRSVYVFKRDISILNPVDCGENDIFIDDLIPHQSPYCPPVICDSEDPLFIIYTSGSTGTPKGLLHTMAGYLLYASVTQKYVFDFTDNDIFGCMADIGWITGHSYVAYGPLCNGGTTLLFESVPTYPNESRYWETTQRLKLTHLYTAPTVIRMLKKYGNGPLDGYDLSSLRVLGSVGEPINDEAWLWFFEVVGGKKCHMLDTYWQSETGGIVIAGYAGISSMIPGYASIPFMGIDMTIECENLGDHTLEYGGGRLYISNPWPGIARTVYNHHSLYVKNYFGNPIGFYTGDGALRANQDGYFRILGRLDDVINVSGHRLSTAEIEAAICKDGFCVEAAVVAKPDPICGSVIAAFVVVPTFNENTGNYDNKKVVEYVKSAARKHIGAISVPRFVYIVTDLPKTRSGKILRRLIRNIVSGIPLGDTTTIGNPKSVDELVNIIKE